MHPGEEGCPAHLVYTPGWFLSPQLFGPQLMIPGQIQPMMLSSDRVQVSPASCQTLAAPSPTGTARGPPESPSQASRPPSL